MNDTLVMLGEISLWLSFGNVLHCQFSLIKTQEEIGEVRHTFKCLYKSPEFPNQLSNEFI